MYDLVRQALRRLGYDEHHYGTPAWNPLRGVVEPGMSVVIKPNLVVDTVWPGASLRATVTHGSVLRPLLDYVRKALAGQGRITLGDAPIQRTHWRNVLERSGLAGTLAALNERGGPEIEVVDFRREVTQRDRLGVVVRREIRPDRDFVEVDLGAGSTLAPLDDDHLRFRVSQYDPAALQRNHSGARHCYLVHRRVLDADAVINVPKMKVHKKAGLTGALKNIVGITCGKDWLPHYRIGDAETGAGDQYARKSRLRAAYTRFCDDVETGSPLQRRVAAGAARGLDWLMRLTGGDQPCEGSWHGNDTAWRMVHDLNLVLCYAARDGQMTRAVQRRVLHVLDGVIGGENDGPLNPTAHAAGLVIAGTNPLCVDAAAATVMGFDVARVPLLRDIGHIPAAWQLPLTDPPERGARVMYDDGAQYRMLTLAELAGALNLQFRASEGWRGHIERAAAPGSDALAAVAIRGAAS